MDKSPSPWRKIPMASTCAPDLIPHVKLHVLPFHTIQHSMPLLGSKREFFYLESRTQS